MLPQSRHVCDEVVFVNSPGIAKSKENRKPNKVPRLDTSVANITTGNPGSVLVPHSTIAVKWSKNANLKFVENTKLKVNESYSAVSCCCP